MADQLSGGESGGYGNSGLESLGIVEIRVGSCDIGSCDRVVHISVGLRLGSHVIGPHKNLVVGSGARMEV